MVACAKKVVQAILGMHYLLAAYVTTFSLATTASLRLTPTLHGQESFHNSGNTWWNHELQLASHVVIDRRRHRRRKLRQRSLICLSPLQRWFVSLIESIGLDTWEELNYYNVTSLAYFYKHHVSSSTGQNEYFGIYGEETEHMKSNHESLKRFWAPGQDEMKSNVFLLGMHGEDLEDRGKLVPTLQQLYLLDAPTALTLADKIQSIIQKLPDGYNNPLLTANALAIQSPDSNGSDSERDSIIIGDGVFAFLKWLQVEDRPDYIHSHEFSHHLQYDLGIIEKVETGLTSSEETRRLELMSDMFGSYYLAHKSGGGLDSKQLDIVHRAAFSMGDCASSIGNHHGSPRQRECASNYGANLAIKFGGSVLLPVKLQSMFDAKLTEILELTADECRGGLDESVLENTFYGQNDSGKSEVLANLGSSGGYWWDSKLPVEDVKDLNIPSLDVPPPSADIEYTSWGYSSGSGDNVWESDAGWDGNRYEWYSQDVDAASVHNSPEKMHDDDLYSDEHQDNHDWFGEGSHWMVLDSGSTKMIVFSSGVGLICSLGFVLGAIICF